MRLLLTLLFVPLALGAQSNAPIFRFSTDELWLNLHHFLYVLGRAQAGEADATRDAVAGARGDADRGLARLTAAEQATWREAVSAYAAGISKKDLVFDAPLPGITSALAAAGDSPTLVGRGIDSSVAATLERAAPIYRKAWWAEHRGANRAWRDDTQANIDRYGPAVLAFIVKAYRMPWPGAGFPVHISGYSNWAGAYSTDGNLLVVSSLDPGTTGSLGLETVFHEAMHQWDDAMFQAVREQTRKINKLVPANLTHAMIFYTAGEAVRRTVPGHVPYAEAAGVWGRGIAAFREPLRRHWQPYLDGQGTREEALARLVAETATQSRPR